MSNVHDLISIGPQQVQVEERCGKVEKSRDQIRGIALRDCTCLPLVKPTEDTFAT